jgi:uncharacterized protein (DUF1697 family)
MTKYFAFLRAINVGGHTVKMDHLRQLFESLGFSGVETFIASGNVIFDAKLTEPRILETKIEAGLKEPLGYEVATFIRTGAELADIAAYKPFKQSAMDTAAALNIALLAEGIDDSSVRMLMALRSDIDDFHVHQREVYWLCLKKQSESTFSNAVLERTLGRPSTLRGVNTIRKIVEKYASG